MKSFSIVAACFNKSKGIGYNGRLPWKRIPEDMKFFNEITSKCKENKINSVIMGRKTFESMNNKPLKNRVNIVLSSKNDNTYNIIDGVPVISSKSLSYALNITNVKNKQIDQCFVIGGQKVFEDAMSLQKCKKIHLTQVEEKETDVSDVFFPNIPEHFKNTHKHEIKKNDEGGRHLSFLTYENKLNYKSAEKKYLNCLSHILKDGELIKGRNNNVTKSLFSKSLKFDINVLNESETDKRKLVYQVPAMTTKQLFIRGVAAELIWFLSGNTDVTWLQKRGIKIWNGNSTREFLDSVGLHDVPENNIGLGYGFQWINWNGKQINQIKNIINTLRKDPTSRSMVLSAWNVGQLDKMALKPCHMTYVFKVTDHNKPIKSLNCHMTMRSGDMFLGLPFNILSTAFLTILISRCVNMYPKQICVNIADAHIYENHIEQSKIQIGRTPYEFPKLIIDKDLNEYEDFCIMEPEEFQIKDYYSHSALKAEMAV